MILLSIKLLKNLVVDNASEAIFIQYWTLGLTERVIKTFVNETSFIKITSLMITLIRDYNLIPNYAMCKLVV
jgi:hypothetical protein